MTIWEVLLGICVIALFPLWPITLPALLLTIIFLNLPRKSMDGLITLGNRLIILIGAVALLIVLLGDLIPFDCPF